MVTLCTWIISVVGCGRMYDVLQEYGDVSTVFCGDIVVMGMCFVVIWWQCVYVVFFWWQMCIILWCGGDAVYVFCGSDIVCHLWPCNSGDFMYCFVIVACMCCLR